MKLDALLLVSSKIQFAAIFYSFSSGTISDMPAVNTFAIYATVAVFFDFLFQTTAFVALLAVDESRYRVTINYILTTYSISS